MPEFRQFAGGCLFWEGSTGGGKKPNFPNYLLGDVFGRVTKQTSTSKNKGGLARKGPEETRLKPDQSREILTGIDFACVIALP